MSPCTVRTHAPVSPEATRPGFDHPDDEAAEHRADDGGAPAEDRRPADEHGRDRREKVALSLVAEIVAVLEGQEHRRNRREPAHQREEADLLLLDIDADDP